MALARRSGSGCSELRQVALPQKGLVLMRPVLARASPCLERRQLLTGMGLLSSALLQKSAQALPASAPTTTDTQTLSTLQGAVKAVEFETVPSSGLQRLVYTREGWNWWSWEGHRVHYAVAGPEDAPPLLLIHGYGASTYHWRYTLPALATKYRVYAMCLLGFGWSEKALVDYTNGRQWVSQIRDFITQVVGPKAPVVLIGNSLGGYASLATAARHPELVRGVALLNGAGPISDGTQPEADPEGEEAPLAQLINAVVGVVKRVVLFFAFIRAKQPERIREVLELVYVNKDMIDDQLVDSIVQPALDPQASEVFFRVNHRTRPPLTVNALLARLQSPLLLLWGAKDPWITMARAEAGQGLYPSAELVALPNAGHCPHDDAPAETNAALLAWLDKLPRPVA